MNHASLFSGICGFDLASTWTGWENIFMCENNPFCQRVIKYYYPNSILYGDIKTVDFTIWRGKIDILSGGPPCQPASIAGKRKGTSDDRWLWPEAFRAVREIKPKFIVFENPPGIVSLEDGKQFEWILSSLENEGYQTEIYNIPACGVEAPHERQRIFFVAYSNSKRQSIRNYIEREIPDIEKRIQDNREINRFCSEQFTSNSDSSPTKNKIQTGRNEFRGKVITNTNSSGRIQNNIEQPPAKFKPISASWDNFPTQSPICSRNDGVSAKLDGITFPKWRNESIKGYGNAVVVPLVYQIFKAIDKIKL